MKAAPFEYHAPRTAVDAAKLLAELPDAKVLAGGQSLVPLLASRAATYQHLIDLRHVAELRGIERRGDDLWIGAMTTQSTAEHSAAVREFVPLLANALPLVAHFQIRNRGTIGGSIAYADPVGEIPAVALALDAVLEVESSRGRREIPVSECFIGAWVTSLAPDELLTGIRFPIWSGRIGTAIEELSRRHADPAIAGACVALELDGDTVARCAIGLINLGATPVRAVAAEELVVGMAAIAIDPSELGRTAITPLTAIPSDLNGSADYRARIGATMVARAWQRALEEATNG